MRSCGPGVARSLALACTFAGGCTSTEPSDVENTVASLTTTTLEAESLTRTSSAVGTSVASGTGASGGAYVQLNTGSAVNDWIELTLPNLTAGTYGITMYFKSNNNRGINQASLDGVNLGAACDEYLAAQQFLVPCNLGSRTLTAGNHKIRFTVTGKNAASTGYGMTIDSIVLALDDSSGGMDAAAGAGGNPGTGGAPTGGAPGMDAAVDTGGGIACQDQNDPVPSAERVSNGGPLLPPKWAFGVLWGSYYDQIGSSFARVYATPDDGNLLTAADRLRKDYGGDLMWIDSSWLSHNYSNDGPAYVCFQFDPAAFPDPGAMIGQLRDQHFHFGVWEWAWMGHGCQFFDTAVANKYFIMNGGTPALASGGWHGDKTPAAFDYTRTSAFNWWVGLNKPLSDWGLDFMKLDLSASQVNSPVTGSGGTLADSSKNLIHEYHRAAYTVTKAYAAAHDPRAMLNGARGLIMPKQSAATNDQMPGWWTNDTDTSFDGMKTEMGRAAALDTTSTAAYWAGDTGGYRGKPTDELYIRWLEYTTFTPLQEYFGSKSESGSIGSRFPWMFGTQARSMVKSYMQLRYQLLPFRYSNALTAYFVKPTVYPVRWVGTTQLLVGQGSSQLLVQPVTTAGATTASVTLPSGTWIHYWTGKSYTGTATVNTRIDQGPQVPLFVKAGSIIPMGPNLRWVDEVPANPLTLDIYPSGTTSYTLYEDDGVSEGYLGGAYSTTKFTSAASGNSVVVSIGAQQTAKYHYAGQLCQRGYVLSVHGRTAAPAQVTRDGVALPNVGAAGFAEATVGWYYDSAKTTVWVKFPLASSDATSVSM
jgi:Glycosyl hydrolases family 31 TIM-barrel domain/Domain of unknown function (DUF5110)/Glycosyl hydrolase family 31 C-terminal domain